MASGQHRLYFWARPGCRWVSVAITGIPHRSVDAPLRSWKLRELGREDRLELRVVFEAMPEHADEVAKDRQPLRDERRLMRIMRQEQESGQGKVADGEECHQDKQDRSAHGSDGLEDAYLSRGRDVCVNMRCQVPLRLHDLSRDLNPSAIHTRMMQGADPLSQPFSISRVGHPCWTSLQSRRGKGLRDLGWAVQGGGPSLRVPGHQAAFGRPHGHH